MKEMSYQEKYSQVLDFMKLEDLCSGFIVQKLGNQALTEFQKECATGVKPISEDASYEDKYDTALSNWAWRGGTKFSFMRNRLGQEGVDQLVKFEVELLKNKIPGPVKLLLKLMRAVSPHLVLNMTAKQMANMMRAVGTVSMTEPSRNRIAIDLPHCKLVVFPRGEEGCVDGCQRAMPAFLIEQFRIDTKCNREGSHCTFTLTPMK